MGEHEETEPCQNKGPEAGVSGAFPDVLFETFWNGAKCGVQMQEEEGLAGVGRGRQHLGGGTWNPHVGSCTCCPYLHPSRASLWCGGKAQRASTLALSPMLAADSRAEAGLGALASPRPRSEGHHRRRKRQTTRRARRGVVRAWQKACELVWAVGGATGLQLGLPRGSALAVPRRRGYLHHLSPATPRISLGHWGCVRVCQGQPQAGPGRRGEPRRCLLGPCSCHSRALVLKADHTSAGGGVPESGVGVPTHVASPGTLGAYARRA